jgi:hypothetical protein
VYHNLKISIIVYILFSFLVSPSFSQVKENKPSKQQPKTELKVHKQPLSLKWKNLSEQLTDNLLDTIKSKSYSERPLILGRLSGLWWRTDNSRAKEWLKTAVSEVTFDSLVETESEKAKRLEVARKLIKFVISLDKQLAETLIVKTTEGLNQTNSSQQQADELIRTALQIVDQNPKLAKNLGSASLKIGQSYYVSRLIGELYLKDSALAESLFSEAILIAKSTSHLDTSLGFISSLSTISFNKFKGKSFSENSQKEFLTALFEIISVTDVSPGSQKTTCKFIPIVTQLISFYETHFPEKAIALSQKSNLCKEFLGESSNLTNASLKENKPETVDEYLEIAKETKDKILKAKYFNLVIEKLYQSKHYERIIAILDDMNKDDRSAFGEEIWESWRWESATQASIKYAKEKDFASVYRIINNTPKSIRPIVQSGVAKELKGEDRAFAISLLDEARKGLDSSDVEPKDKANLYLFLVSQYAETAPFEAINIFRETAKAVNKSDEANPENKPIKDYAPLKETIPLPLSLFETDEIAAIEILTSIKTVNSKVRFYLGFIEQTLKSFEKAKSDEQKQINAKDHQN